jgi:hypothetical protein
MKNVHGCGFNGGCDPRLAGESDREWQARIDAARVTAELKTKLANVPSDEYLDMPLFGGPRQGELFS